MEKRLIKKLMRSIGILLAMAGVSLGVTALRIALFAPELMSEIFHVIGG